MLPQATALFAESLSTFHFTDKKRLQTLLGEAVSAIKSSVVPKGNRYAAKRVQCTQTRSGMVDEIWNGLTQLFTLNSLVKEKPDFLAERFERITQKLFSSGAVLHVIADEDSLKLLKPALPDFIVSAGIRPLEPPAPPSEDELYRYLLLPGEKDRVPDEEFFAIKSQVGFASRAFKGSRFGSEKNPSELVLSHWLSGNSLWERIRTAGGAYGAYSSSQNLSGLFCFSTFRDPAPVKSMEIFSDCLSDFSKTELDDDECERNITGTYGDEVQPRSPNGRGTIGFFRTLYCISDDDRRQKLEMLLKVTPKDLKEAAERIYLQKDSTRKVIVGNKDLKNTGVIIELPL